jgi:hypothetical protein
MTKNTKPSLAYYASMMIAILLGVIMGVMLALALIILIW